MQNPDFPRILVVTHGAWLGMLLAILRHPSMGTTIADGVDLNATCVNTSVMQVRFQNVEGKWKGEILSWGDASHLNNVPDARLGATDDLTSSSSG